MCPDLELELSVLKRSPWARIPARYGDFLADVNATESPQDHLQIEKVSTSG